MKPCSRHIRPTGHICLAIVALWWMLPVHGATEAGAPMVGSLTELLDFRSAPTLKPWRTLQASGYDREGGFYDSGNFLRVEEGPRYVLMEADGPGCIDRMWFTYKKEIGEEPYDLRIYLDDAERPAIDMNLDDLFSGERRPFVAPLAGLCGGKDQPARYSYVPIGFQKSCRVVLVPTAPLDRYNYRTTESGRKIPHVYYQITWRKCPPDTPVRSFRWRLERRERRALERIEQLWSDAGSSPWSRRMDAMDESVEMLVEPESRTRLFDIKGAGIIHTFQLHTASTEDMYLEMNWDGVTTPQVAAPVPAFFAGGGPAQEVRGLWLGYLNDRYYCHLPMPFRRGARISIRSESDLTVPVVARVRYTRTTPAFSDGLLHARRYDFVSLPDGEDYVVLDEAGPGHFIGLVMDRPGHMEGDDRFFVDGETTPSIHGTGTEDFFNFAWGLSHVASYPLHGITREPPGPPTCYRFHLPAAVPFNRSLRIAWEHGHFLDGERKGPNLDHGRYSGVAFFYRTPPSAAPEIP